MHFANYSSISGPSRHTTTDLSLVYRNPNAITRK